METWAMLTQSGAILFLIMEHMAIKKIACDRKKRIEELEQQVRQLSPIVESMKLQEAFDKMTASGSGGNEPPTDHSLRRWTINF